MEEKGIIVIIIIIIIIVFIFIEAQGSIVVKALRYLLDSPGINSL